MIPARKNKTDLWLTGEAWLPSYEIFRDRLSEELRRQVYFSNPNYPEMVNRKFGPTTAQQVQEMASYTLEKKYLPSESSRPTA